MRKKLIVFPCAGGAEQNYRRISSLINCDVNIVEYSGHWTRYEEALYDSMETCINSLFEEVVKNINDDEEVALLGHSMGAIVAYEVCKKMKANGYNTGPLFIVACDSPDKIDYTKISFKNDDEVISFLRKIRQIPEKVLDSHFFEDNLLPFIRNDIRIVAKYLCDRNSGNDVVLDNDIIAFYGNRDCFVESIDGWSNYTNKSFKCFECNGDHFFVYDRDEHEGLSRIINHFIES